MAPDPRPVVAGSLAVGWLIASLADSAWGVAAVATAALVGVAWTAVARRRRRLPLAVVLLTLGAAVAALLAAVLTAPGAALRIQVVAMVVLVPLVPLAYAATFDRGDRRT